jgi:hypothetical protein
VECGAKAEEALSSIRTVKMLRGEAHEFELYRHILVITQGKLFKYGLLVGLALGFFFFMNLSEYAIGFYAGSKFIEN